MNGFERLGRVVIGLLVAAVTAVVGWLLFVETPTDTAELLGVLLVIATVAAGLRIGSNIAANVFPDYNVAEVAVEGPITRDGGGGFPPSTPGSHGANKIVDLIENADEDDNAEALVLRLNTPGGAVVPSDDIRLAAKRFDGPTIAYATDVCASGGYWIASGCDELWTRDGSVVGSIGVRGSRMTASDRLEKGRWECEQRTAGEFKEAGGPFEDLEPEKREYLQGIIDDYYDQFVETVAEGRAMDEAEVRDTEAKVFLGSEAHEMGLVDSIGTHEDVEERLESILGEDVSTTELEPQLGVTERLRGGAESVAYAVGAGIASQFTDASGEFRFRV